MPYLAIFKIHWFNYITVSILLGIPLITFWIVGQVFDTNFEIMRGVSVIAINLFSIYVYPLVFILQKKWESIKVGVKCIIGNAIFSMPLLVIVAAQSIIVLFYQIQALKVSGIAGVAVYIIFMAINLFVDFIVFISATLILREKLLN